MYKDIFSQFTEITKVDYIGTDDINVDTFIVYSQNDDYIELFSRIDEVFCRKNILANFLMYADEDVQAFAEESTGKTVYEK